MFLIMDTNNRLYHNNTPKLHKLFDDVALVIDKAKDTSFEPYFQMSQPIWNQVLSIFNDMNLGRSVGRLTVDEVRRQKLPLD